MPDEHAFGVELLTPESALFAGAATAVILRTSDGDLTVLDGHTALVGDVVAGVVRVEAESGVDRYCVHGGFLQVRTEVGAAGELLDGDPAARTTRVTILAGVAEPVGEIDVARAQAARDAAAARLLAIGADAVDEEALAERIHASSALARAELRLESAGAPVAQ